MKKWHVMACLEFDVECEYEELEYMIKEFLKEHAEEIDIWDDSMISFEQVGDDE